MSAATAIPNEVFASAAELETKTQGAISRSAPDALPALRAATREIRRAARWHIWPPRLDTRRMTASPGLLALPTLHLRSISEIRENGSAVPLDGLVYDVAGPDSEYLTDGLVTGRRWSTDRLAISVTFEHGFDEVPDELRRLCLQIAARDLGSPLGVVREQTLTSSVTHATTAAGVAGGSVILDHEDADVAPYRIPLS